MADVGDQAGEREELHREEALARRGLRSRVTAIPEPHYEDTLAVCRVCGAPAAEGKCRACRSQVT